MSIEHNVEVFLKKVKKRIEKKQYDFIHDDMVRLTNLGLSITDAINIVKHLGIENYYRGPTKDHRNHEQEIYEFGTKLDDLEIYIKLTIGIKDDLFIMSFHEAKKPIIYPFNKKGRYL
ncbi:MAG: type II toxin-antitoxin system MqsR family toxin [Candidatus Izemoplasmataceae bacterium]